MTLALVLSVVTTAVAAVPGDPFKLGTTNTIDRISTLVGSASGALLRIDNEGDGPALDLRVNSGEAPMKVNSTKRVNDLNADQVDGKSAAQLEGLNGLTVVRDESNFDSSSPSGRSHRAHNSRTTSSGQPSGLATCSKAPTRPRIPLRASW